ncbi:MAG: tetratricopeptide repeat protein [Chloroflexota bacterium]
MANREHNMSQADELKEQGVKQYQDYEYEQAIRTFEDARAAYVEDGQEDMAAEMLANIGLVHRSLGEGQQALESMGQALKVFQKTGDALRAAQVLGNMGGVYAKLGDTEQAYNTYRQAADLFEELGEKDKYGQTLLAMGRLQLDEGKFLAGAATYEVALENVEQPTWQQRAIKNLGSTVNRMMGTNPGGTSDAPDEDAKPNDDGKPTS